MSERDHGNWWAGLEGLMYYARCDMSFLSIEQVLCFDIFVALEISSEPDSKQLNACGCSHLPTMQSAVSDADC